MKIKPLRVVALLLAGAALITLSAASAMWLILLVANLNGQ